MLIEEKIKYRVVGLIVVVAFLVILIPLFVNHLDSNSNEEITVAEPPQPSNTIKTMKSKEPIEFQPSEIAQIELSPSSEEQDVVVDTSIVEQENKIVKEEVKKMAMATSGSTATASTSVEIPKKTTAKKVGSPTQNKSNVSLAKNELKVATSKEWQVQLGSFSSKKNADQLAETLRKAGYIVITRTDKTATGKNVFRVLLRSSLQRKELEIVLARLEKKYRFKSLPPSAVK